jgi:hypothetical protein
MHTHVTQTSGTGQGVPRFEAPPAVWTNPSDTRARQAKTDGRQELMPKLYYYGRQSLQPFGWMPIWYAFASAMLTFVPAVVIARVQNRLHGARSLLLIPLVIMTSIGAVVAVSWPMYLAMSSTWSDAIIHLAALSSIALVGVAVWFCAPLVAQSERALDRSIPVTAAR